GYFAGGAARLFDGADLEADGANSRTAAAAVALADSREIILQRTLCPRIGAHRNLGPERRSRDRNRIGGFREQIVRDKLVVAFYALLDQIEVHHAILAA